MKPIYDLIGSGTEITVQDLMNIKRIEEFYDTLLDLAAFISIRTNPEIDKDFLEHNAGEKTLLNIIKTQLEVNGLINFLGEIGRASCRERV